MVSPVGVDVPAARRHRIGRVCRWDSPAPERRWSPRPG